MRENDRTRTLMAEILLACLFFLVCTALLVRTFGAAYSAVEKTGARSDALDTCRSVVDTIFAAQDKEAAAKALGFGDDGTLALENGMMTLNWTKEENAGGTLYSGTLTAGSGDEVWFEVPVAFFEEVRP